MFYSLFWHQNFKILATKILAKFCMLAKMLAFPKIYSPIFCSLYFLGLSSDSKELMYFIKYMKSMKSEVASALPSQRIEEFHEIHEIGEVRARVCHPNPKNWWISWNTWNWWTERLALFSHPYEFMNFMKRMKLVKTDVTCPHTLRIDEFYEIPEIGEVRGRLSSRPKELINFMKSVKPEVGYPHKPRN